MHLLHIWRAVRSENDDGNISQYEYFYKSDLDQCLRDPDRNTLFLLDPMQSTLQLIVSPGIVIYSGGVHRLISS